MFDRTGEDLPKRTRENGLAHGAAAEAPAAQLDVDAFDYAKFLLQNAYEEGRRFWTRNAGLALLQTLLLGVAINTLATSGMDSSSRTLVLVALGIFGIVIAWMHFAIINISQHYNHVWLRALDDWLRRVGGDSLVRQLDATETKLKGKKLRQLDYPMIDPDPLMHLAVTLRRVEGTPCKPLQATSFVKPVPLIAIAFWVVFVGWSLISAK